MGLGSWLKSKASGVIDEAEDLGSSALHEAEDVGSSVVSAGSAAVDEVGHLAGEAEGGVVKAAEDVYAGGSAAVDEAGHLASGAETAIVDTAKDLYHDVEGAGSAAVQSAEGLGSVALGEGSSPWQAIKHYTDAGITAGIDAVELGLGETPGVGTIWHGAKALFDGGEILKDVFWDHDPNAAADHATSMLGNAVESIPVAGSILDGAEVAYGPEATEDFHDRAKRRIFGKDLPTTDQIHVGRVAGESEVERKNDEDRFLPRAPSWMD